MANSGQHSQQREAIHRALPRLYKFALVLTANEDLGRALLRSTCKTLLSAQSDWREEDPARLTNAFRRMYSLWSAKIAEEPDLVKKCPPDPRIFASTFAKGPLAGNVQFGKFIADLPAAQRGVLYLVYGEGASYDEATEITQLNMLTLMKLLARGHLALTDWLDGNGGGGGMSLRIDPSGRERAA
jgi:RNA polymerase sigma-70 factor (ECF subfamily)